KHRQRDGEKATVGTRQSDKKAPCARVPELSPSEVIKGADRAKQKQRFGVYRAEEHGERKRGDQPDTSTRPFVVAEHFPCEAVEIHERAKERAEGDDRSRQHIDSRCRAAEQAAHDPRGDWKCRKENDVLLLK